MTWEWVAIITIIALCGTTFGVLGIYLKPDLDQNSTSVQDIEIRLSQIEAECVAVHLLAEQTKKLLSEANLVKGFRSQR